MPIRCEIVSQDRIVYQDDVDIVVLPGVEGVMGILPNHAPLLTTLKYGIITVRKKGEEQYFTVAGGVAEVLPEAVVVLADAAENVNEINLARAEEARRRAEELLSKITDVDTDEYLAAQAALRRSTLRISAAQRYRSGQPRIGGG
ncbi:MAG: ATP synthase F1 subunit epsilon [Bellilinea sp.]|jgi:F-type H+-transporting ATPase subunit epsilon|nr:ATP synthase F1 subunit epsilon [Bellilinea sp.]